VDRRLANSLLPNFVQLARQNATWKKPKATTFVFSHTLTRRPLSPHIAARGSGRARTMGKTIKRCSHGRQRHHCKECNPCPHGRVKQGCVVCTPCPHGKLKKNCAACKSARTEQSSSPEIKQKPEIKQETFTSQGANRKHFGLD